MFFDYERARGLHSRTGWGDHAPLSRNTECPNCKGAGYLFVGLRGKATTSESVAFR